MFDPFLSDHRHRPFACQNSKVPQAVFGEILGQKSLADLQDLLTSVRYRMNQMAFALGAIDPSKVKDPRALAALFVDVGNLKNRVNTADTNASAAIIAASWNPMVILAATPAQGAYDALVKSIKQGYPPAAAQIQRGDYDDVVNRIKQIGGVAVDLSQMPQPRAADPDLRFMQQTTPIARGVDAAAAAAEATAREAEKEGKETFDLFRWIRAHETELLVAGGILSALWLYSIFVVGKAAIPHVIAAAKTAAPLALL